MPYIGNQSSNSYTSMSKQTITGNGGKTYTLTHAVANSNEIEVFVNNVRQEPTTAYAANGTVLTMTGNVANSDSFYAVYIGKALQTVVPPDNSVGAAQIADNSVGTAQIADNSVGTAQIASSANLVATNVLNTFTKAQIPSTNTSSGLTINFDNDQNFFIALSSGSNALANPTTEANNIGQTGIIIFTQPASGAAGNVSHASNYKTVGGEALTLSTANNAYDVVPYIIKADNFILLGAPQLGFA